jgi:hypothetical protein
MKMLIKAAFCLLLAICAGWIVPVSAQAAAEPPYIAENSISPWASKK